MKLLLDFLPLLFFFATFSWADANAQVAAQWATTHLGPWVSGGVVSAKEAPVLLATLVVMAATLLQALITKLRGQKIELMLWISLGLVMVLGGLTLWLHNETFIKWKPTGLYWTMAVVFFISERWFGRNLLRSAMGQELPLPDLRWQQLNLAWAVFFIALGALNLFVAEQFSTAFWAKFKVFGITALVFVFVIAQGVWMSRYLPATDAPEAHPKDPAA